VKFIGTPSESEPAAVPAPAHFGKTTRYASVLPSFEDCIPQPNVADDDHDWRAVSWRDIAGLDHTRQALAFAQTLPAMAALELMPEDSGVREISRLRLALDPRDSDPGAGLSHDQPPRSDTGTPTMRVTRSVDAPLTRRARQLWQQQTPFVAIICAAALCVASALVASWLAP
jgi:hypothetical protein